LTHPPDQSSRPGSSRDHSGRLAGSLRACRLEGR
jgi:hypothetical protein